jgi:hypothetical protein
MMTLPEFHASQTSTDDALHRLRRRVNRLFAAIFVVLLLVTAFMLALRYVEAVDEGRQEAGNLTDLLSEYLVIRLRGIDGALSRIAADNRRIGGLDGSEREWASAMRSAIAGVPGLSSLIVLDADGVVRHATVQQIRGLSWADRGIFRELAKGIPNRVVVDPPVAMVAGSQVLVPFGRALTNPRGEFIGAIVALLLPNQLRDFLGTFDLGQTGIAWVLLPSGEVLFRDGAVDALRGLPAAPSPAFVTEGPMASEGIVRGPLVPDGADYLTGYRKTAIANLVVAVSIAGTSFLSRWRNEVVAALLLIVVAGGLLFVSARRINAAALDVAAAAQGYSPLDRPT